MRSSKKLKVKVLATDNCDSLDNIMNDKLEEIEIPEKRDDGVGYIDEPAPCESETEDLEVNEDDGEDDGSSIVESTESGDEVRDPSGGWPEEEEVVEVEGDDEDDMLEWGVEDEDWELADGGELYRHLL